MALDARRCSLVDKSLLAAGGTGTLAIAPLSLVPTQEILAQCTGYYLSSTKQPIIL